MTAGWDATGRLDMEALLAENGDRPAVHYDGGRLSWRAVAEQVGAVSAGLAALGIGEGQRVGFYLENQPAHFVTLLACWARGSVFVPLNWKAPAASASGGLPMDLLVADRPAAGSAAGSTTTFAALVARGRGTASRRPLPVVPLAWEAAIIYTSGSSGPPKGVVHTIGSFLYSAGGTVRFYGMQSQDSWLVSLPLFHVGGLLVWVRCMLSGGCAVFPSSLQEIGEALVSRRPAFVSLVPTQLIRLTRDPRTLSALRACKAVLVGGAAATAELIHRCRALGIPISPTYGATETCAQVTAVPPDAPSRDFATVGRPLAHRRVRLDAAGRIEVGGRTLFSHYLVADRVLRPIRDGWLQTPDTGRWDERGNLVVLGRSDLIFQSGGENINPEEIERHLLERSDVLAAVVVPVSHPEFGQVPWALVATSGQTDPEELASGLKMKLPPFMVPKRFLPLAAAPGGGAGKPDRTALTRWAERIAAEDETHRHRP